MKLRRTLVCLIAVLLAMMPLAALADPATFDWSSIDFDPLTGLTTWGVYDVDNTTVLAEGDFVQLIWAGPDGQPDPANCDINGTPGGDDVQIGTNIIRNGYPLPPPKRNKGYVTQSTYGYDTAQYAGQPLVVYIRAWNEADGALGPTTYYGNSQTSLLTASPFNALRWHTDTECGPNAIEIAGFDAQAVGPAVEVSWQTASEIDVEGFNVWRSASLDGTYVKVNEAMILANGGPARGADYVYTDASLPPGDARLYYKLEVISAGGSSTFRGPVSVDLGSKFKLFLPVLLR